MLGLQCNGTYLPRTDVYAGVLTHYESLIKKYQEVLKVSLLLFYLVIWGLTINSLSGKENERICERVLFQKNQIDGQWRRTHQSGLACTMDQHYWTHHQTLLKEARERLSHQLSTLLLWKTRRTTSFEQSFFFYPYNLRKEPSSSDDNNNCGDHCLSLLVTYDTHKQLLTNRKYLLHYGCDEQNIDNSVLFCQHKITGFRSFEQIKKSFLVVYLVFIHCCLSLGRWRLC